MAAWFDHDWATLPQASAAKRIPALMEGWQKLKEWRRDIIANPPVHVYPESKQEDEKKEEPAEPNDVDNKAKAPVKL